MSTYCRLCAKLKQLTDLTDLESNENLNKKITIKLLKINAFVDFELNLAKTICFVCLKSLDSAFEFVTEVQNAQMILKDLALKISSQDKETQPVSASSSKEKEVSRPETKEVVFVELNEQPINTNLKLEYTGDESDGKNSDSDDVEQESPKRCKFSDHDSDVPGTTIDQTTIKQSSKDCTTWNDISWKCAYCTNIYSDCKVLTAHSMDEHNCCNPYVCTECSVKRYRLDYYIDHIRKEHRPHLSKYCYECNKSFSTISRLNAHIKKSHRISKHICNGCNASFKTIEELNDHIDTFYLKNSNMNIQKRKSKVRMLKSVTSWEEYTWKCAVCEVHFSQSDELISHSIEVHKRCNPFRCIDCNRRPFKLDTFIKHVQQQHNKALSRSCYKCCKTFYSFNEMRQHRITHRLTRYMCEGCNACFSCLPELTRHKETYFKSSVTVAKLEGLENMYNGLTCLVCNTVLKNNAHLLSHLTKHTERTKQFACEECGQMYVTKSGLDIHMMKHTDPGPFKCEICAKLLNSRLTLRKHVELAHRDGGTFSCDHCKKSFRTKKYLANHLIMHSDELPWVCDVCKKAFKRKAALGRHMQIHTGVKNYFCELCQRDFLSWSNYNKHMVRKHNMDMSKNKRNSSSLQQVDDSLQKWKESILNTRKRKIKDT